ncbi:MAG: hypothetical protein V1749_06460 [Candidatus Desantisbacteria bacterium]
MQRSPLATTHSIRFSAWFKTVHHRVAKTQRKNNPLTPFFKGELEKYSHPLVRLVCYPDLNHARFSLDKYVFL